VAADDRGPFPAKWGGENAETSRGFALYEYSDLSVVVWKLDIAGDGSRRRERESPARGERCSGLRYGENARTVHRCS
jgi:hypothetical protein